MVVHQNPGIEPFKAPNEKPYFIEELQDLIIDIRSKEKYSDYILPRVKDENEDSYTITVEGIDSLDFCEYDKD